MPLNIRWKQKDYLGIALMLFGACGIFQAGIIIIAQYAFSIDNYLVITLIPIGVTIALFYCSIIVFDSFAQVERRRKIRRQFRKLSENKKFRKFLLFPIVRPLLILFSIFIGAFLLSYVICYFYLTNIISFIIAENIGTFICILIANLIEKSYGKVQRY
ncbi:MAG: hypothetical protein ACFFBP_24150 [Promethearchaeota archaeon]